MEQIKEKFYDKIWRFTPKLVVLVHIIVYRVKL